MKRSPMKRSTVRRFWEDADAKMPLRGCRACGGDGMERAHLVPRRFDEVREGPRGGKYLYVEPDNIVALCRACHEAFDAGTLSLIGKLTMRELRHVVSILGKHRARRRLSGGEA